jgi:hypothetical protein
MIQLGRYQFPSEEVRKADYRHRVGPKQPVRTFTPPNRSESLSSWLNWMISQYLAKP